MPILKKEEALPARPVIILIYGEPGIGKTSLFNTSDNPLLIDFDRGVDRSIMRQDTLIVSKWEDIEAEEKAQTFSNYSTIGIDTAKAALDDFLMAYVQKKDHKNAKNKLAAYGAIGDDFKVFIANRRSENADIVIIAHSKDEKDGDVNKKIPDVTGGSFSLLLRIADQVGYMKTINNKRTIQFEPSDTTIGKNVARLETIEVPNETDPLFKGFMARLIQNVKTAISAQSEAQQEAIKKMADLQEQIEKTTDSEDLTAMLNIINEMSKSYQYSLKKLLNDKATSLGLAWNKEKETFVSVVPTTNDNKEQNAPQGTTTKKEAATA